MEDLRRVTFPQAQKPPNELQQLPIKRTTRKKIESVAKQCFQFFSWFGFERKAW
jgi:hypothetical protein